MMNWSPRLALYLALQILRQISHKSSPQGGGLAKIIDTSAPKCNKVLLSALSDVYKKLGKNKGKSSFSYLDQREGWLLKHYSPQKTMLNVKNNKQPCV